MRVILTLLCLVIPLAAGAQSADEAAPKPRTYALVAAVGEGFHVVVETMSTGSHLPPYKRKSFRDASVAVNQLVARELAQQVMALDPAGRLVVMMFPVSRMPQVAPAQRPQATFAAVVAELERMPDRRAWDRILVVTPAYRALRIDGMAADLEGMGLFIDPLCESDVFSCSYGFLSVSGPRAQRPDGSLAPANSFFAPYFYATLWELDAATLEVIAKREVFQHQKMSAEDEHRPVEIGVPERARIEVQLATLVNRSMHEALKKTDLMAHVEVYPLNAAEPGDRAGPDSH